MQVHLADIMRRAGFAPDPEHGAETATPAPAGNSADAALPPAFQEWASPERQPAGTAAYAASAGSGTAAVGTSAGEQQASGATVNGRQNGTRRGITSEGLVVDDTLAGIRPSLNGNGMAPSGAGSAPSAASDNAAAALSSSGGSGMGRAWSNGAQAADSDFQGAVSAAASELGKAAGAAPSSANAAPYDAPAAAGLESWVNENVAGLVAQLNPAAADAAGALLQPSVKPYPDPEAGPSSGAPDRAADPGGPLRSAGAGAALPLVPSGADASAAAAGQGLGVPAPTWKEAASGPTPRAEGLAQGSVNPAGRRGRALRRVASTAAGARRRRGFDPDFDRTALFLNPLRRGPLPLLLQRLAPAWIWLSRGVRAASLLDHGPRLTYACVLMHPGVADGHSPRAQQKRMPACPAWVTLLGVWCVLLAPDRERRASRGIIAPMVLGTENLPDPLAARARPLLFVGNHTRFGLYDLPFLVCELYLRGFKARRHSWCQPHCLSHL